MMHRAVQRHHGTSFVVEFVQAVEQEMKKQGMTLTELARRAKIGRPYLHRVLSGEHAPTLEWAEKVAAVLGLAITVKKIANRG